MEAPFQPISADAEAAPPDVARSLTLIFPGELIRLGPEEFGALSWLVELTSPSSAVARLVATGGLFERSSLEELAHFVVDAPEHFTAPLEVWRPLHGPNVCLRSQYGWHLVRKLELRYLNRSANPPAVHRLGRAVRGAPHTLGHVLPLRQAHDKLVHVVKECLRSRSNLRAEIADVQLTNR